MIDAQYFRDTTRQEYDSVIDKIRSTRSDLGLDVFDEEELVQEESKIDRRMAAAVKDVKLDRHKQRFIQTLKSIGHSQNIDETLAKYESELASIQMPVAPVVTENQKLSNEVGTRFMELNEWRVLESIYDELTHEMTRLDEISKCQSV